MNYSEKKLHRCCFTGHRPYKLNCTEQEAKYLLERAIDEAIKNGYVTFITGMALGVDIWAAEILIEKKKHSDAIRLICAVPHPGFERNRSEYEVKRYKNIIQNADYVKIVNDGYFSGCYQVRNEYMVDRSSLVIAMWNGTASGTKNTIDYADRKGVKVVNVLGRN